MRVMQLIDAFEAGGAERMAINIANALSKVDGVTSFIVASRTSGPLESAILPEVSYSILGKRRTLDRSFFKRIREYVRENRIEIIHAHSTSFFYSALVKMLHPKVKVVWHDHYGKSESLPQRKHKTLGYLSKYFDAVISVNELLMAWAKNTLKSKRYYFLNNFVVQQVSSAAFSPLEGEEGSRIVCLANLRPQKDHINLLKAFMKVKKTHDKVSLHLLGKDFKDAYAMKIRTFIKDNAIEDVYLLGSQQNVPALLDMATIGVLSSKSEGLPLALLEYGMAGLPVVVTDVGQCASVVQAHGSLVPAEDPNALASGIMHYLTHESEAKDTAIRFNEYVMNHYTEQAFMDELLRIYKEM